MCKPSEESGSRKRFKVTITETLRMTVEVKANNLYEAEQMISDGWHSSKYVLGSENFADVKFEAEAKEPQ